MWARINKGKDFINSMGLKIEGASEFLCESVEDIFEGPNSLEEFAKRDRETGIGSTATIISTAEVYVLSPSRKWMKYGGISVKN